MKYSQARQGRVFVIRLEDGDVLHEEIEALALKEGVKAGMLIAVGGADKGSKLVVGPEDGRAQPVIPMETLLEDVSEVAAAGTLFQDESGTPILHMHAACGRNQQTTTGCVRNGVKVWHILEVILIELLDTQAARVYDEHTGFKLLNPCFKGNS